MKTRVYVGIWESTIKTTINKHLIKFIFGSVLICPKLLYNELDVQRLFRLLL